MLLLFQLNNVMIHIGRRVTTPSCGVMFTMVLPKTDNDITVPPERPTDKTCMRIKKYCRMGNNLMQMLRAAQVAKRMSVRRVKFPSGLVFQYEPFILHGVYFEPEFDIEEHCRTDSYYFCRGHWTTRLNMTLPTDFQKRVAREIGVKPLPSGVGAIHLRGGDVFTLGRGVPSYGQPPCRFYENVIQMEKWEETRMSCMDDNNPCVGYLMEKGVGWQRRNLTDDLKDLLGAKAIAVSRGTFGIALACMSANLERYFSFRMPCSRIKVPYHMTCIPDEQYERVVMSQWKPTHKQLELLMTATCTEWKRIEFGDPTMQRVVLFDPDAV